MRAPSGNRLQKRPLRRQAAAEPARGPGRRRPTLKDVADAVGVHISTVSRALNPKTRHHITPEISAKILKASAALNYRQNAAAYTLRTNRTRIIGVIIPDITNPVFPPIIRGIEDALAAQGYMAILVNTDSALPREASVIDMLCGRGVDGVIAASVERDDPAFRQLAADGIPVVTVNRRMDDPGIASIVNDDDQGIRAVLDHLVAFGHRRIANIAGPQKLSTGKDRLDAFLRHRDGLGLAADERLIVMADGFNEAEGERCAESLLARQSGFTALVCSNDRLAIGAIAALRRYGHAVPGDVSVTGFNDMPLMDRLEPPLTTIRVPQYVAGRMAAEMLLGRLEPGAEAAPQHETLPVELVVRASTGPRGAGRGTVRSE
jgi:LacI family transcriptional regulator, galactose operon repressor